MRRVEGEGGRLLLEDDTIIVVQEFVVFVVAGELSSLTMLC